MKRKITLLLVLTLITSLLFPIQSFAQEDKGLEKAITTAKTLLEISDDYNDFSYSISTEQDKTVYTLMWNDTKNKLGNVRANVDSNGMILSYYSYKPIDSSALRTKIPSISKVDAQKTANEFIAKVNPSISGKIKSMANNLPMNIYDSSYQFNYHRVENGIPYYQNSVYVSVDNRTGKVENFYCNWTDNLVFPNTDGVITLEKAQQAYAEKLGLKLAYKMYYNEDGKKPMLVYTNVYSSKAIDAKTGQVVDIDQYYGGMETAAGASKNADSGAVRELSPEERNAVENAADFISQQKAEDIARKAVNLDGGYILGSINLYSDSWNKGDYEWNLYFSKEEDKDQVSTYSNAHVSLDAKTGEVMSFYKSIPYNPDASIKYNKEQALEIARDFIKSMQPKKYAETEFTDWGEPVYRPLESSEQPRQISFTFTRRANNAYFLNNGFNITIDTTTGTVTDYNFTWYKGTLPSTASAMSADKAHNIMFDTIGIELRYTIDYTEETTKTLTKIAAGVEGQAKPETRLVYGVKQEKQLDIDAVSGELLDYSGNPYEESIIAEYTDINGITAESKIRVLAQYGISLPGKEFKPDLNIAQRYLLYMIAKAVDPYTSFKIDGNDKDEEKLYEYMISNGIIKESEKSPWSAVSKEDAAKFIIRAMNYGKLAEIKGIYKLPFADEASINKDLYGYVAIAYGFNIIKDDNGSFNPASNVSRAQAAEIIYNYLNN